MQNTEFKTGVIKPIEVYKEAWELMKSEYWLIFAITIVGILIGSVVPIVLIGPMMCGIYMCLLDKIEGRPLVFDRLFKGFDFFLPGLVIALIIMIPTIVFIFAVYIPMIGVALAGQRMNQSEMMAYFAGVLVFELIIAVVMICIHTLVIFSFPLVVDRKLTGWQAIRTSARAVWANLGGIAGLFGVGFLVCMGGYLLLCVGVYLALPIVMMANAVAYRKIFPSTSGPNLNPPTPYAYQGL